jgi:hypothetical protein
MVSLARIDIVASFERNATMNLLLQNIQTHLCLIFHRKAAPTKATKDGGIDRCYKDQLLLQWLTIWVRGGGLGTRGRRWGRWG